MPVIQPTPAHALSEATIRALHKINSTAVVDTLEAASPVAATGPRGAIFATNASSVPWSAPWSGADVGMSVERVAPTT